MKKEYNKPNMEIVSFATENIAVGLSVPVQENIQKGDAIKSIKYY